MHKTQVSKNIKIGEMIYGKCLHLNAFNLLIINENLPLILEDCRTGMHVNAFILKNDTKNMRHFISLSPFISTIIREKSICNPLINTFPCVIKSIEDKYIECMTDAIAVNARIDGYMMNEYYIVTLLDYNGKIAKLDTTDCLDIDLHLNDIINVFIIDDIYVSMYSPGILYAKPSIGMIMNARLIKNDKYKALMHISRGVNATMTIDLFCDTYFNKVINIGWSPYECIVVDNKQGIIISHRWFDITNKKALLKKKCFYKARIINPSERMAIIEVLNFIIYVTFGDEDPEKVFFMDEVIFVECISISEKVFRFAFLLDDISFEIHDKSLNISENLKNADIKILSQSEQNDFDGNDDDNETQAHDSSDEQASIPSQSEQNDFDGNDDDNETQAHDSSDEQASIPSQSEQNDSDGNDDDNETQVHSNRQKAGLNQELSNLKPIIYRPYPSKERINPKSLKIFLRYLKSKDELEAILPVAKKVHLSPKTVGEWFSNIKKDQNWSPLIMNKLPTLKAMTDVLEGAILWHIYKKFLEPGYQINDKICKSIALAFWEKFPKERLVDEFRASSSWVRRFKRKNGLVNRRAHIKKRTSPSTKTIEKSEEFLKVVSDIYAEHERNGTLHYLINIDETNWKYNNFGGLTWASKGVEHVECNSIDDDKRGITVLAAITASPDMFKLPLCIIKKGSTNRALNALSDMKEYFQIEKTANGWTTTECFIQYLNWLRIELNKRFKSDPGYTDETKIDIILDLYAAHRGDRIKRVAESLNFKLHYIPPSFTDIFQPLDRYVFGSLKSMARSRYYKIYAIDPTKHFTLNDACKILIECWAEISEETRKKAWLPYSNPEEVEIEDFIMRKSINFVPAPSELTLSDDDDIVPHINESSDDSYYEEEDESLDIFNDTSIDIAEISDAVKSIVNFEHHLVDLSMNETMVKPISNDFGTCSLNVLIQILSVIPGIKDDLNDIIKESNGKVNDMINALSFCLSLYEEATTEVENFPLDVLEIIPDDITFSIDMVLRQFSNQYGLTLNDERWIVVIQHNYHLSLKETIQDVTKNNDFIIHRLLLLKKDYKTEYLYPEVVDYPSFVMVLKILIVKDDDPQPLGHFRLYIREFFSENWLMVNDNQIKSASIEDAYEDNICMAIYYILNKQEVSHKEIINEENTDTEDITTEITEEMELHEEIKTYLEDKHPGYEFREQIVTKNEEEVRDLDDIRPLARVVIKASKKK